MVLILAIALFLTFATALFAFGTAVWAPASTLGTRLRSLIGLRDQGSKIRFQDRLFHQALDPLSRAMPHSPGEVSRTRAWLMQAGYRESEHLTIYFAVQAVGALGLLVLVMFTGIGFQRGGLALFFIAPILGLFLPRFVLKRKIRNRQRRIQLALADGLDLAVICIEAGLGLDQAIQRVSNDLSHSHPELSDELSLVNLEMRAGKPRAEALRNLAARTGVDDVRALVAVLLQTDRFGTSIAQALRVHSDALRTERRQRAEEAAAKTSVKMVPILVFFMLPTMFFVCVGPAVIQAIRVLLPAVKK
jgi:tight adherence protein C